MHYCRIYCGIIKPNKHELKSCARAEGCQSVWIWHHTGDEELFSMFIVSEGTVLHRGAKGV